MIQHMMKLLLNTSSILKNFGKEKIRKTHTRHRLSLGLDVRECHCRFFCSLPLLKQAVTSNRNIMITNKSR
jgi:hypothetical protein